MNCSPWFWEPTNDQEDSRTAGKSGGDADPSAKASGCSQEGCWKTRTHQMFCASHLHHRRDAGNSREYGSCAEALESSLVSDLLKCRTIHNHVFLSRFLMARRPQNSQLVFSRPGALAIAVPDRSAKVQKDRARGGRWPSRPQRDFQLRRLKYVSWNFLDLVKGIREQSNFHGMIPGLSRGVRDMEVFIFKCLDDQIWFACPPKDLTTSQEVCHRTMNVREKLLEVQLS